MKCLLQIVTIISLMLMLDMSLYSNDPYLVYSKLINVELEKTKITEIIRMFGYTKGIVSGDASTALKELNYYFLKEKTFVTFSSSEMGGGEYVDIFYLNSDPPKEAYTEVKNITFSKDDFGGIRLGLTKSDFIKRFKDQIKWEKETAIVMFHRKKSQKNDSVFSDEILSITAKFRKERLSSLSIFKSTQY